MSTERRNPRTVDIDLFPTERILKIINAEDALVPGAVAAAVPDITRLVDAAVEAIRAGGRVIYAGAGTSGRIGIVDAAEVPPTFGAPPDRIQAVMAGGTKAFAQSIEGAEDEGDRAAADFKKKKIGPADLVVGVAAAGATPYTLAAVEFAKKRGAKTGAVVCVENSPLSKITDITVCVPVGPEVITGSTRMKAGTAQKMVLNMLSTAVMVRLGMTYSNWMISLNMSNQKLQERGKQILHEILGVQMDEAAQLIEASGANLKLAVIMGATGCDRDEAEKKLASADGNLRRIVSHLGTGRE